MSNPKDSTQAIDQILANIITRETHKGAINRVRSQAKAAMQQLVLRERRDEASLAQQVADNHSADNGATVREVLRNRIARLDSLIEGGTDE